MVLDETILSLSAGGGRMRMSRGGRGGNRWWMMRRVMSLCRGGSGCSGSKYGTGGRGSLGREWRDHRCGYRGGLLTRQHRRCNTYTYTVCRLIIVSPFQRERKKKKKERGKKKYDRSYARSIVRTSYRRTGEYRVHSRRRGSRDSFRLAFVPIVIFLLTRPRPLPPLLRVARAQCSSLPVFALLHCPSIACERANE